MTTQQQFKAARRVSVPLIIWKTPDAAATINTVKGVCDENTPLVQWDFARGVSAINKQGAQFVSGDVGKGNPVEALELAMTLTGSAVLFIHNAHKIMADPMALQAVWNLRDVFKSDGNTLVLLAPQMQAPMELANDVLVIDEALPSIGELEEIIKTQAKNVEAGASANGKKFLKLTTADIEKATDAVSGLSAFAAEQSVAMSFDATNGSVSLKLDELWERKRQAIEETRGLKVWRGGETFADIGGCENIKKFLSLYLSGRKPPRAVVFVDELEKSIGEHESARDQLAVLLTQMEDSQAEGVLFIGHPGSAKSMIAKATGNTAQTPTIRFDLGGMMGEGLMGQSQNEIRAAMKIVDSVSQGRAFYIATCNNIGAIPPELQRRFTLGTFFFDLPSAEERAAIWKLYLARYEISTKGSEAFVDDGWTGADIHNCCKRAWMFKCLLSVAAAFATPICKTRPRQIEALRDLANGAFISASHAGLYEKDFKEKPAHGARRIS